MPLTTHPTEMSTTNNTEPSKLNQEEIYAGLTKLIRYIEQCGASTELTNAVVFASEIKQAVGNQWNKPNEMAAQHVKLICGTH